MSTSTHADHARYLAEGYVVVKGVIDIAILASINREIGELFAIQLRRLGQPVDAGYSREAFKNNAARLLKAHEPTYISTARLTQYLPSVNRLLISDTVMRLVREFGIELPVIAMRPTIILMTSDLKISGGYQRFPGHQDWRSMQGSLDSIVLWIPTTPVKEYSNPIELVPRSHLLGLLGTVEQDTTPAVSDPRITDDKYIPIPAEPGDVIFFSSFMVHRSSEADDGLVRVALIGRFNNAREKTYVEHAYPTGFKYNQTSLIYEGFPTLADVAAIFPGGSAEQVTAEKRMPGRSRRK